MKALHYCTILTWDTVDCWEICKSTATSAAKAREQMSSLNFLQAPLCSFDQSYELF